MAFILSLPSVPLVSEPQTAEMSFKAKLADPRVRQRVEGCTGLLIKASEHAARRIRGVDPDDLMEGAFYRLINAAANHEEKEGAFVGRARVAIRRGIWDALRAHGPVSRSIMKLKNKIRSKAEELREALGRDPTDEEMAAALHVTLEVFRRQRSSVSRRGRGDTVQLSAIEGERQGLLPRVLRNGRDGFADRLVMRLTIEEILKRLTPIQQDIVRLYYLDETGYTLEEVGKIVGLSGSRACQVLDEVHRILGMMLEKEFAPPGWMHPESWERLPGPRPNRRGRTLVDSLVMLAGREYAKDVKGPVRLSHVEGFGPEARTEFERQKEQWVALVANVCDGLPPQEKMAVRMHYGGYRHKEIAEALGMEYRIVSRVVVRVRQTLREAFSKQLPQESLPRS